MKKLIGLLILFILNDLVLLYFIKSYLAPIQQVVPEPIIATGVVVSVETGTIETQKKYIVCKDVCSGNDELVQYAWEKTKDLDFILTIIQESHFNPRSVSIHNEYGLIQWTKDTLPKKHFIESQEFNNGYRQVDRAWEDRQRWIPYPEVINRQLAGYKDRYKWKDFVTFEYR